MRSLSRIEIKNFGNHKNTILNLNQKGLYVFTGENGSGKSTIVDAIVWCIYKRSIRATSGWKPNGKASCVTLFFDDGLAVWRDTKLNVQEKELYTGKIANDRCVELFGSYQDFMRSFILHKRYLSRFSMATDAEKKSILETILGFEKIEIAHKNVKSIIGQLIAKRDLVALEVSSLEHAIKELQNVSKTSQSFIGSQYSDKDLKAVRAKLGALNAIQIPSKPSRSEMDRIKSNIVVIDQNIVHLYSEIDKLESSLSNDRCDFCGSVELSSVFVQDKIKHNRDQIDALIEHKLMPLKDKLAQVFSEYEKQDKQYQAQVSEYSSHTERRLRLLEREKDLSAFLENKKKALLNIDKMKAAILDKSKNLEILQFKLDVLNAKIGRYEYYLKLYGNKGVKLNLLSDTLNIITEHINIIYKNLFKNHSEHRINAYPVLESKPSGISLGIKRLGVFIPYSGLSEGEKNALDISVLKSLYYLSAKNTNFPIVYDDVFDSFDDHISESLVNFVCNESKKRTVFVITHNYKLLDFMNKYTDNIKHYQVKNGCVNGYS